MTPGGEPRAPRAAEGPSAAPPPSGRAPTGPPPATREERIQLFVGTTVLIALVAAVVFVVAIWPRLSFGGGARVYVAFAHVGALREGAPVVVAGRSIGHVESISLVDGAQVAPTHPLAGAGGALVAVRLDDGGRAKWAANAEVFVSSKGVLSGRYLELGPPARGAAPAPPIATDALVRGIDPPLIDRALQRTWDNLMVSRRFLEEMRPEVDALRAALAGFADALDATEPSPGAFAGLADRVRAAIASARELGDTLTAAGADPAALAALADRAERAIASMRAQLAKLAAAADLLGADVERVRDQLASTAPATMARLRSLLADVDAQLARAQGVAANARGLLAILARGEGSLARLSNDPEFPEDAKELGRILKRTPWRILGHTGRDDTHPDP